MKAIGCETASATAYFAGNTRDAVAYGVSTSARTITSAALIMIAVFIGFAFSGMPLVAQLGVASAVAIAVDATVVRLVLVPALLLRAGPSRRPS